MKRMRLILLAGVCAVVVAAAGDSESSSTAELEALVGRWVALRGELAAEKQVFKEQQEHRGSEIEILEARKQATAKAVEAARETGLGAAEQRASLESRASRLRDEQDALRDTVARAEDDLRRWKVRLPSPLLAASGQAFEALPRDAATADAGPLARRLQTVLALYTLIESLQSEIHVVREVLPVGSGRRREADVVYLGLARGFAVTRDDAWAAVGHSGADGWSWEARPELAVLVRRAVQVADRELPAELVALPLRVASREPSGRDGSEARP